ncbi:2TM domain-containing protein [Leptolyngbya cf. ectocarpi LEGE 11479]|uniref:2TM domain-containing protein n=1 Tax=Leptolyngbya cf. ectocarpi LEGE 11479 TaxID=1828722 RepID=A0A928ZPW2_LEPEC|nr:2TM domain-containing protein [Leptolyngbya ectocarpi]MBE9065620.1 2TM domain-containing protein [Leptolyngbya cf. ectocarpi LEGE 11479]
MEKRYSTEEVQQILVQAMGQRQQEGFSRSQLEAMADDLGISSAALMWAEQNCQELSPPVPSAPLRPTQPPKQQTLHQRLRTYAVVNAFLLVLNFTLSGSITWAIYPLLGWGLSLLLPVQHSPCTKRE